MWKKKTAVITLKATEDEVARWKAAATQYGYPGVGPWLRALAQGKVKELGGGLPKEALTWRRGAFVVRMTGDVPEYRGPQEVKGLVAGPFGIYRGAPWGLPRPGHGGPIYFTVVHVPSAGAYATLKRLKDCKELARRLFRLKLSWYQTDPSKVTGPGIYEATSILALFLKKDEEKTGITARAGRI